MRLYFPLIFIFFSPYIPSPLSDDFDDEVLQYIHEQVIFSAEIRDYDRIEEIFQTHLDYINYSNNLDCTIVCEFTQLLRGQVLGDTDPAIDLRAIDLALEYGARPNSSAPALNILAAANDLSLAVTDEARLPLSSGECLPERDLLVPLANRMAELSFDYSASAQIGLDRRYTQAALYVFQLCHNLFACGAQYEIAPESVKISINSSLTEIDESLLLNGMDVGLINSTCLSNYIKGKD